MAQKVDFRIFLDPFWGFILKTVLGIYDPRNSWWLFGTKNHEMRGPPVITKRLLNRDFFPLKINAQLLKNINKANQGRNLSVCWLRNHDRSDKKVSQRWLCCLRNMVALVMKLQALNLFIMITKRVFVSHLLL